MYPPSRPQARAAASSATSPRTNPLRSNNDRDSTAERRRYQDASGAMDATSDSGSGFGEQEYYTQDELKLLKNLNAIVQQFFVKGALTLVGSRVPLAPAKLRDSDDIKYNKWFNLVLPESDALADLTAPWRATDVSVDRPPPMIIEIYLDLAQLTKSQKLIILDDDGKRWDVAQTLNQISSPGGRPPARTEMTSQVVLERWTISLDGSPRDSGMQASTLSAVYKRGIPLFRSLFTYGRTMPAFRYSRRLLKQPPNQPTVKLNYRILSGQSASSKDTLNIPLALSEDDVTERYSFEPLQCSAGTLNISVAYRMNCDFRVDDTESLMSSHFMASDDTYFRPSLAGRQKEPVSVPSSVPNARHEYSPDLQDEGGQVYGSLSTFHRSGGAAPGTSPLSAIRAIRDDSTPDTPPQTTQPGHRRSVGSKSSLRSESGPMNPRRPSVSFQPFKAGSLASSPGIGMSASPGTSFPGRNSVPASLTHTRNRPSLTTLPQQVLRTPQLPNETAIASSASSSPKPAPITRYSSSFSHRRSRFSSAGSKGDDDQNSSGKQSASSSAQQPGSEVINESQRTSDGSMEQAEDDKSIQDFIKLLESKKDLKSFSHSDSAARDASMRRTSAALSKYRGMRESNTALSDSMSSSLLLQPSSSSSSRQLTSVPPMVHGTSASTSSSPGKPISPHTPHTPAIPSRLSDNLTIEYNDHPRRSQAPRRSHSRRRSPVEATREENSSEGTAHDTGTIAIDIPTSPRAWPYVRRSSSASGQHHDRALDDEPDLYGMIRSASVPADERASELSMSELLRVNIEGQSTALSPGTEDRSPEPDSAGYQAYPFPPLETSRPQSREDSSSRPSSMVDPAPYPLRRGLTRQYRRGSPSFSSGRGSGYSAGSRLSMQTGEEEELIFQLSELGSASRRSLEETRGGGNSGRGERRGGWQ